MRLNNPNDGKPFDRVAGDYGYRNEHTSDEEIVHIPTNESNQKYYQPEMVLNPEGCDHEFVLTDIGKREVECKCGLATSFIPGVNTHELHGKLYFTLNKKEYLITSL